MIEIFATSKQDGIKERITDLYWFEERGVHDFDGSGMNGEKYTFEIWVNDKRVYPASG